jgi:two-component system, LytTR family, response regulator
VELHAEGRSFVVRKTLTALQAELDPRRFARIHRSLLVRVDAVIEIEPLDSARHRLRLASGRTLISGRSYCAQVRECFGLHGT